MSAAVPFTSRLCIMDVEVYPNFAMIGLRLQEPDRKTGCWYSAASPGLGRRSRRFAAGLANMAGNTCGSGSTAWVRQSFVARILEGPTIRRR